MNQGSTTGLGGPGETARQRWQLWYCGVFFFLPVVAALTPRALVLLLILVALAAVAGELRSAHPRTWRRLDQGLAATLAILVSWSAIAALWSPDQAHALLLSVRIACLFAAGLFLHGIVRRFGDNLRRRIGFYFLAGCLTGLAFLVIEVAAGFPFGRALYGAERLGSDPAVWLNRNAVAMAILCWPTGAYLWRRGARAATVALIVGSFAILSFLSSLAALTGMAAGAGMLLVALVFRRAGRAILILATILALVGSPLTGRLLYALDWQDAGWLPFSAQHRVEIWHFTALRIAENPVFGWGFDSARDMGDVAHGVEASGRSPVALHPHNVALQILLELGMAGALIALAVAMVLINRLDSLASPERAFGQATYIAALTISCTAFGAWQNWWLSLLIWSALAMTLMLSSETGPPADDQELV